MNETCKVMNALVKESTMINMSPKKVVPFEEVERRAIICAIKMSNGNITRAAKELCVGRATLYRKIHKYGLERKI